MGARKIVLIDANNLAYRAFYALPETISTTSGTVTNAVYGFTSMLLKLIEEQKPHTIICAFDSKIPTFRHKLFEEYKIQRKKMPFELVNQIPLIKEILDSFNIPCVEVDGYEADDVLASIACLADKKFDEILIVTGDKDMLQLVSDKIKVMAVKKGITDTIIYDKEKVKEKFGVEPVRIRDLLALMGDSSDNIPGIPGIGPKIAQKLLAEFKTLDNIYQHLDEIKSESVRDLLSRYREQVDISKKLVELNTNLEVGVDGAFSRSLEDLDYKRIEKIFDSLEFKTLKERIKKSDLFCKKSYQKQNEKEAGDSYDKHNNAALSKLEDLLKKIRFKFVKCELDLEDLCTKTSKQENLFSENRLYLAIGCERSYSLLENAVLKNREAFKNKEVFKRDIFCNWIILSSGFSDEGSSGFLDVYYIDESVLLKSGVKERIKQIVEDRSITKSGFDFKNIYKFLRTYNINLSGRVIDYKIIHLLLNPSSTDVNFEEVVKSYTGVSLESIETSLEKNLGERKLYFLACLIGLYGEIENKLLESLEKEGLSKLYFDIEGPLIRVLAEMEFKGVSVDLAYLNSLIHEYEINIKKLEEEIYNLCNQRFNINSPQQLSNILYGKLGLPVTKKTKKGLSTDAGTLTSIFDKHPVVEKILDYREKVKLKNTYIDVLPGLIDPEDKRIHTTYNQLGTSTGRISSIKPNLQNIPIRTELGREIRKAFIPGDGYNLLMSADYSQIELRVLAHLSEDTSLIEAFNKDEDIHTRTASEIFGVRYEEVDENLRRKAKAINFGIIYGMTEYGLGNRLSISEDEAKEYIKTYFERYPKVKKYIDYLIELAYKRGYTTTLFGRKRYIPELGSSNTRLRSLGERLAVNTPIQGSAADIMKLATVLLFDSLKSKSIDCNIILHVHDELVLELKEKDVEEVRKIVKKSMEDCIKLKVKLKVDIKTGKNWYI